MLLLSLLSLVADRKFGSPPPPGAEAEVLLHPQAPTRIAGIICPGWWKRCSEARLFALCCLPDLHYTTTKTAEAGAELVLLLAKVLRPREERCRKPGLNCESKVRQELSQLATT